MRRHLGRLFWIEASLAALSGALAILTMLWQEWIEALFHVDPDASSGSLEWVVVAALLVFTVVFGWLAKREHAHAWWAARACPRPEL